jgi:predicted dehydrogenase
MMSIQAVATSRPESAKKAEEVFKCKAYSDFHQLVKDPEVDVVIVSVKVPEHLKLTTAAIEAKKHVICEWPLGRNTAEAIQLAELADKHGVKTVVGLQARGSPAFAYIKDLIKEGYIGELLSTTTVGQGAFPFNGPVPPFYSYLLVRIVGSDSHPWDFSLWNDWNLADCRFILMS